MKIRIIAVLFFALFFFASGKAQNARFGAGIIGGLNASQILGDDTGGYNKLGLQGGLRGIAHLTDRSDLYIELLYSQRGSYQKGIIDINLKYVEVPVVLTFKDWLDEEGEFYKVAANIGFSYGRLLNATAEGSKHDDIVNLFNDNDISFTVGAEYFTRENFGFGIRWSKSINFLYNKDKHDPGRNSLRGFFLSFRGVFTF
ncbi:MAG: hypothetical protein D6816_00370 [Bacteroidetes bacterium]|nr:MAG: hypothetical protein D6816_00370 [Bacteroidota bacterium]